MYVWTQYCKLAFVQGTKRQSPVAFSGIASHLFTLQHLFLHNQHHCPIIRPDRGWAVNQRFILLCPISPSWWILMGTYLALQWWRAGGGLLELHWHPQHQRAQKLRQNPVILYRSQVSLYGTLCNNVQSDVSIQDVLSNGKSRLHL